MKRHIIRIFYYRERNSDVERRRSAARELTQLSFQQLLQVILNRVR